MEQTGRLDIPDAKEKISSVVKKQRLNKGKEKKKSVDVNKLHWTEKSDLVLQSVKQVIECTQLRLVYIGVAIGARLGDSSYSETFLKKEEGEISSARLAFISYPSVLTKTQSTEEEVEAASGSDDEIVEIEPDVENVVEQQRKKTNADDVDNIIDQVISKTEQMEIDMEEPSITISDDIVVEDTERSTADDDMSGLKQPSKIIEMVKENESEKDKEIEPVYFSLAKSVATMTDSEDTEPLIKVLELNDKSKSDEESISIEDILKKIPMDMMLPSATATEITRIKVGLGIEISGVNEGDWYKASLTRIATSEKGKASLVSEDEIKGHLTQEMFSDGPGNRITKQIGVQKGGVE
ncbi:hypothetical protein F511_43157 [Dorcoceras hygrometricum]|uniref:Splicing factor 3B subunit 1-like n=1 Tax=Dorcoceras hygrometricum TaxID=472368 RepID=A0A2Z7BSJ7_9LAMI|nr:hypothetical protein F511_43157 [Dorcoceras hygrometricum]